MRVVERAAKVDVNARGVWLLAGCAVGARLPGELRVFVAFRGVERVEFFKVCVDIMRRISVASTPIAAAVEKLVNVAVAAVADFGECCCAAADMGNACLIRREPINVLHAQAAHRSDQTRFMLLV